MSATEFFYDLTPERILDSVERFGVRCTGRIIQLNSMENRVYEIEIELPDDQVLTPSDRFRVAKFYRPGRWSKEQILEEHDFMFDLVRSEVPVVAPLKDSADQSLLEMEQEKIYFTLFPKAGGRSPDELGRDDAHQVGRLIARMHNVGAAKRSQHRLSLTPLSYGEKNLEAILAQGSLPNDLKPEYQRVVQALLTQIKPLFESASLQRIHGDLHFGNILRPTNGFRLVDFDDMVSGPCAQDIWLLLPGRGKEASEVLEHIITGYEQLRPFDRSGIQLFEPLRALRLIHFSAWIGKRWSDPAFPRAFPHFGSMQYWREQIVDLNEQLAIIQRGGFFASLDDDY